MHAAYQPRRKFILAIALLWGLAAHAATINGRVVGVADGDSITVLDDERVKHKVRLSGIDAPEKAQAFGRRSKESLSEMVFSKTVDVETSKKDRYGRDIGKILLNGLDVNLIQVQRGFAWHYKEYQAEQSSSDRALYNFAESEARVARRGLWGDADPVPPWEHRKAKRARQAKTQEAM